MAAETLAPLLDQKLDGYMALGAVGAGLYVERGGHVAYQASRGSANLETGEALRTDHLFRMASVAKTYLSTLILELHLEGRLSIDDPITEHLPPAITSLIPDAEQIAIIDLLTFWSGIADYRDETFAMDAIFGDHTKVRDEYTDLIDGLTRNPTPCARPRIPLEEITPEIGECLYSNTNYVLLGYIADKVLYGVDPAPGVRAEHHSQEYRELFFGPLGLENTYYEKHLAPGESFYSRLSHAYFTVPPSPAEQPIRMDVTTWDDGYGYANGGLVATMADTVKYRRALFDATITFPMSTVEEKAELLNLMKQPNGIGVAPAGFRDGEWWIFSGDIGGHVTLTAHSVERNATILFYSNDRDHQDAKYELVQSIEAMIDHDAATVD